MAQTDSNERRLSDEQLDEVLRLMKDADSVELKLTIPATDHRSVVKAFDMDPLEAQMRQVFFFDTPDLALNTAGVVVRGRRVQGRGDDTVVKLRPVVPNNLSPERRASPNFGVEVDAMPGGYVCSASFKGALESNKAVRAVGAGKKPIRKLFSKEQRSFYADNAPEGIALDDLSILGPLTVLKLKFKPKGFSRKIVAELWFYPDGSRILELSTKCLPEEGMQTAAESRAFLSKHGVDLSGEQQTKTKTALDYFSEQLAQ